MILTKEVELITKGLKKLSYYKDLGYNINNELIIVDIKDLIKGSSVIIQAQCDFCGDILDCIYSKYTSNIKNGNKYACSLLCGRIKSKLSNLEKYGVENVSQSNIIKEKKKETCIKNWGVDCNFKSNITKEKKKETCIKNLGVDNPSKSSIIKEKKKETSINNYGVGSVFQSDEVKDKIKKTNLEKYGFENPMMSKYIKMKLELTNLERYGFRSPMMSDEVKDKVKETNLERHGVEYVFQSNEIKDKIKKTNLEKYGVEYPLQSECIKNKSKETNLEKYGVEYASQSKVIKDKIKNTNLEKYGVEYTSQSESIRLSYNICNDISYIKYLGDKISLFKCSKGHNFEITSNNYKSRSRFNTSLCTVCNPIGDSKSIKEKNLLEFIQKNYSGEIIPSYRDGLEIDIYLPEMKIGFEFNGLYWHSEKFKDKNYHLSKTNYFKDKGIRIIHIWEDDWTHKEDIIKSQIFNLLNKNTNKIFSRKCVIKEVDTKVARKFLDNNHIQGKVNSVKKIGLYYNKELVSIMTFDQSEGRKKMEEGGYNLNRFCNKLGYNVIGGASKLLSYFIKKYKPIRIVSYADKDWSIGNLYYILGFENIGGNGPDYKYIVDNKRVHKSRYKKSKLKTILTESKTMKELGIDKIYDCGKIKFELKNINI